MKKIINYLRTNLNPSRYAHTMGVRREAVKLAMHYGGDVEKASLAGLIHDCCKNKPLEELLVLAKELGVVPDAMQSESSALLHGPVGAEFAKQHFKIEDTEVINAVTCHTTGKADMTLLDKIIYIADYIEPTREEFEGLEHLRSIAYVDIDKAMLTALNMSVKHVQSKGEAIHPDTTAAINWLKGQEVTI